MNIDCDKIINNSTRLKMNSVVILPSHPTDFLWNVSWWKKIVNTDSFFRFTNIRKNVQNDSSEFDGLLHKMVYKEPFINQCTGCIMGRVKWTGPLCLITFIIIIEIEGEMCEVCKKYNTLIKLVTDKLIMSLDGLNSYN